LCSSCNFLIRVFPWLIFISSALILNILTAHFLLFTIFYLCDTLCSLFFVLNLIIYFTLFL
jgi:hypothetical protein